MVQAEHPETRGWEGDLAATPRKEKGKHDQACEHSREDLPDGQPERQPDNASSCGACGLVEAISAWHAVANQRVTRGCGSARREEGHEHDDPRDQRNGDLRHAYRLLIRALEAAAVGENRNDGRGQKGQGKDDHGSDDAEQQRVAGNRTIHRQ